MNLQPVAYPPHRAADRLQCLKCAHWVPVSDTVADLDGAPFKAYYCPACAAELREVSNA